ncbi:EAL domain-containing protein [Neisseriaceae bacterium TC5R-5]|nr:EAL domain-containing protein [Neisseriaceae bacterium TC5R-5]
MRSQTNNRQLILTIIPFLIIVLVQVSLSTFSLYTVSTARTYITGESSWSKSQKDAIYYLSNYAQTQSLEAYKNYQAALAIQDGDRRARLALQQEPPDINAARNGLLQGGNHPDDIENTIRGFLWFHHISSVEETINLWGIGDDYMQQLQNIGKQLHQGISNNSITADEIAALSLEINHINERIRPAAQGFSDALNSFSRKISTIAWITNLVVASLLLLLTVRQIRKLIQVSSDYKAALYAEKERVETTLKSIGEAVITFNMEGLLLYMNPNAELLLSHQKWDGQTQSFDQLFQLINTNKAGNDRIITFQELVQQKDGRSTYPSLQMMRPDKPPLSLTLVAAPVRNSQGEQYGMVLILHDNTIEQQYINDLSWQASHDALTGLVNRREFETRAVKLLNQLGDDESSVTLMFIDLDQFKLINDTHGHAAGDELLCQISRTVRSRLRPSDTLARLGGDEFGVLLVNSTIEGSVSKANNLRQAIIDNRFEWEGESFSISASIGLTRITDPNIPLAEVMRSADIACYMAKEKGRNRIQLHMAQDSEISARFHEMDWVQRLRRAIQEGEFRLFAQEIVPLNENHEGGRYVEILLRLQTENSNLVLPSDFIPAAERYGLMQEIDRFVVSKTFTELTLMREQGDNSITHCAINLSGSTLNDDGFLEFIHEQFSRTKIPAETICFEITETNAIANLEAAQHLIKALRQLGCRFSLDDFGAGMSSFAYLKHLPVDYLKIDGSFVRNMEHDSIDYAMVEMIHQIGHLTGKRTIAEFVSSANTVKELQEIGVDYAQGFYLAQPAPFNSQLKTKQDAQASSQKLIGY